MGSERIARLADKGMIAWEVDGVLARLTKGQSKSPDLVRRFAKFARLGAVLAAHMRRRVQEDFTFADASRYSPSSRIRPIRVSQAYAKAAGLPKVGFKSQADMWEAAGGRGAFTISGGMWDSLASRIEAPEKVLIEFASTSQGRGEWVDAEDKKGRPIRVIRKRSVKNWYKAGAVLLGTGQNVIEPSSRENLGILEAVSDQIVGELVSTMDATRGTALQMGGDRGLRESLREVWK